MAALYGLILVSLENIQEDLENPYDGLGADDLNLNVANQYQQVLQKTELPLRKRALDYGRIIATLFLEAKTISVPTLIPRIYSSTLRLLVAN